ncbi:MAG: 1,4-alpha-glucan branching protein GlgB [Firmicutes bacterium]|nr:1,4-alpha-glucan branching protein GlgB [Alicyclobacillaceae bacterium]MCL6496895.1 1,4-alpha-glucan branching protein GlgB [Bacillota bacterium]
MPPEVDAEWMGPQDRWWFNAGEHTQLYRVLGAQWRPEATRFAVWAPNAEAVEVIGDFNRWQVPGIPLAPWYDTGIFWGQVPGVLPGAGYRYRLRPRGSGAWLEKLDPVGFFHDLGGIPCSRVVHLTYTWHDQAWMAERARRQRPDRPMAIYEVHLGSWRPSTAGYRDLADPLIRYVVDMGFTHVELLPVMEHPFYGSWGYQTVGYFAPSARWGAPSDLMALIDGLHQAGVGVILDWVPAHFPDDPWGLGRFDGTHLYEHADPRQGRHPDWHTLIFNYGRHEVRSFLLSSARFWLDRYHADGLRVDAVASMLYRDYSRPFGQWVPNAAGGRENWEAVGFLQRMNQMVSEDFPDAITVAEESTAWPGVTAPPAEGGLGFTYKWDMGWMHDTLRYFARDPIYRRYHQDELTFRGLYMLRERFVLPLSHDEVVHGKGALWAKMPGDRWQKAANLRLLLGYQWAVPGKKLLFMGSEWGAEAEWDHDQGLDWLEMEDPEHAGIRRWVRDLNRVYAQAPALWRRDYEWGGFEWVDHRDHAQSVLSFLRWGAPGEAPWLVVLNLTPVPRFDYRIGVPWTGFWAERLNSDATVYGGSGLGNLGGLCAGAAPWHGRPASLTLTLPPLAILFFEGPRAPAP